MSLLLSSNAVFSILHSCLSGTLYPHLLISLLIRTHCFSSQGSSVFIKAGTSTERATPGGGVRIEGGGQVARKQKGSYRGGGEGGDLHFIGGSSSGKHALNDRAGNIILEGGESSGNASLQCFARNFLSISHLHLF